MAASGRGARTSCAVTEHSNIRSSTCPSPTSNAAKHSTLADALQRCPRFLRQSAVFFFTLRKITEYKFGVQAARVGGRKPPVPAGSKCRSDALLDLCCRSI
jgi:hypothetical protein